MQIDVGYFYFIKDLFFDIMDDPELMKNKENATKRSTYFYFRDKIDKNILWFVPPMSSKYVDYFRKNNIKKQEYQLKFLKQ